MHNSKYLFAIVLVGCGHRIVPRLFTESIYEPRKYISCRCVDYETYLDKKCKCNNRDDLALLGEHCSPKFVQNLKLHMYFVFIFSKFFTRKEIIVKNSLELVANHLFFTLQNKRRLLPYSEEWGH